MTITACTPAPDYRGPVRVAHTEYGWDLEEMAGYDPEHDTVTLATGERTGRVWVLLDGCHLRDGCAHRRRP